MKTLKFFLFLVFVSIALIGVISTTRAVAPADFGLKEGDIIRATGDLDIYIVNTDGFKRLFVNPAIFNLYGHLGWDKVREVSSTTRDSFITSGLFRNCESGDERVYGLDVSTEDSASLHWVNTSGEQATKDDTNFFKKVFCINNAEQRLYSSGAAYSSVKEIPDYTRSQNTQPTPTPVSSPTATPITSSIPTATPTSIPTPSYSPIPTPTPSSSPSLTPTPTLPQNATLNIRALHSRNDYHTPRDVPDRGFVFALRAQENEILIKKITITFLNNNPFARLSGVRIQSSQYVAVVEPNTSITYARDMWAYTDREGLFTIESISNEEGGWQIRMDSVDAVLQNNQTKTATIVGVPLTTNNLEKSFFLTLHPDSPSGLQAPAVLPSHTELVKFQVYNNYRNIEITGLRLKATGQTYKNDGTKSTAVALRLVDVTSNTAKSLFIPFNSGVSSTISTSGTWLEKNPIVFAIEANFSDSADAPAAGTQWQIIIEAMDIKNLDTGEIISVTGLPLTNDVRW